MKQSNQTSNLVSDKKANMIRRKMKVEDEIKEHNPHKEFKDVEEFLKTVSKKFTKDPITLDNLQKAYSDVVKKDVPEENLKRERIMKMRKAEEKTIFHDIFIKPKEEKIKELRKKQHENKEHAKRGKTTEVKSDLINTTRKENKVLTASKIDGIETVQQEHSIDPQGLKILNLIEKGAEDKNSKGLATKRPSIVVLTSDDTDLQMKSYLEEKFIPSLDKDSTKNFFNQLIQIKPPEGINAVVASPLMDSKGWAPSIPSVQINKLKTNLQDLLMRAKGGIQAGDIPKEAHMAFYLGVMNEEEKNYTEALKFYKKYFLSAKLLQDIYGTELALNRIAVLNSNMNEYEQSLYYNEKHKEISTNNINGFVATYNCGLCLRILNRYSDSIQNFEKALSMSSEENDLESYCICLCQIAISTLFMRNFQNFFEISEEFFTKNKTLKNNSMEMEMLMMTGFVYNHVKNTELSKEFYLNALKKSTLNKNTFYKEVSLCNIGLIEGNNTFDEYLDSIIN